MFLFEKRPVSSNSKQADKKRGVIPGNKIKMIDDNC